MRSILKVIYRGILTGVLFAVLFAVWGVVWVGTASAQTGAVGCEASLTVAGRSPACTELGRQIMAMVGEPAVVRAHWGVMVSGMDGAPLYTLNEGQFFQPASNTKLFTTAAAMALLGAGRTFQTRVVGRGVFSASGSDLKGDLVLVGGGEANLSGRELPYVSPALRPKRAPGVAAPPETDPLRYLAEMADAVVRTGLKVVMGDLIGDDTLFPWEPYPEAWGISDMVWGYGAPVSALSIADNQLRLTITPAAIVGAAATVALQQGAPYYTVEANVTTVAAKGAEDGVQVRRAPGGKVLRVYGRIAADAGEQVDQVAIQDPAEYAAMALKAMLEQRGVQVLGQVRVAHLPVTEARGFSQVARDPLGVKDVDAGSTTTHMAGICMDCAQREPYEERVLAAHRSPALVEDVVLTNKVSQNLHAELLLHDLAITRGLDGSGAAGARVVRSFLTGSAGVDPDDFVFFDGSGLSGHDLVTPRAAVRLLTWASGQPWFAAWKASLPVGGEDGTLATRFGKGPLKDHLFAKTGTLGEARALSGYVEGASGRTVAFSVMVTDHAPGGHVVEEVMDRIVTAVAAAN